MNAKGPTLQQQNLQSKEDSAEIAGLAITALVLLVAILVTVS